MLRQIKRVTMRVDILLHEVLIIIIISLKDSIIFQTWSEGYELRNET
jgi:hypothetical protein